jgi:hypothetical protein
MNVDIENGGIQSVREGVFICACFMTGIDVFRNCNLPVDISDMRVFFDMQCVCVTRKAPEDIHIIFTDQYTDKAGEKREKKKETRPMYRFYNRLATEIARMCKYQWAALRNLGHA